MKLVTFSTDVAPELGAVEGERVISLSRAAPQLAHDMTDLIARWPQVQAEARRIAGDGAAEAFALGNVGLLAPIRRPGKIMAIGLNYADHVAETGQATPPHQIWFSKSPTSAHGPYADVEIPLAGQAVDYEAELVAVVGQGGRHISREAAPGAIFGFCVGNDVSERAWQMRTPQWVLGKSFDTHAPFGPWITTSDEAPDPHGRSIRCLVNGEQRQSSNTRHLIFDVWAQVEHLSKVMTLEPGDLIFTGTPGGVGVAMTPRTFLKAGDVVRVEIEGLGAIENPFAAEVAK
ncbi:MAG TPA: fumarylacetoacetate hydrolase family protein [Caulobacteraceae bacterium]|jgi:2-keto-4-pentenoate hydratase/2-oxohepta-3-ene-1,7-dioic acid hydratase in catechol pathway|nr:fumarylacetoacetate hydrolase family protein [Caulobacteraceae bacterium]